MDEPQTTTFATTDGDAFEQFFTSAYGSMRIHHEDRPRLRYRGVHAGLFTLDSIEWSARLNIEVEPLNKIIVSRVTTARIQIAYGQDDWRFTAGDLCLAPYPERPYLNNLRPGELRNCILDPDMVTRVAATAPGRRPQRLRFTTCAPVTSAAAAQWWATRGYIADLLDDPQPGASPLMLANAGHLLAAATLTTFPNNALTDPTSEDSQDAHPASLRRATAFIDENAHRPISPADIAAAARITIRAVQLAFRRHLDTTPTEYLRRVRLHHAHRELLAADPGTGVTVGAVATRWGFANHSRFSAEYRATYGVLPSHTLRR
ncbi:AraC family transcriptional regulator [Catenuloplanes atrovinosus]|nr:helix-turn-helix domain-containing protein [Catenuloplanes atrovinosus]